MDTSSSVAFPVGGGGNNKAMTASTNVAADKVFSASTIVVAGAKEGSHVLTVHGYSRQEGLRYGDYFKSGVFNAGDCTWYIQYHPKGYYGVANSDWISLCLVLTETTDTPVRIQVSFSLLDHTGEPVPSHIKTGDLVLASGICIGGCYDLIQRNVLEESPYLKDDCFRVRCDITVEAHGNTYGGQLITVPPSDMHCHIGGLLSSQEGLDVTFEVDGETFGAHRPVLAARSSVFKAQLFGPMKEKNMSHIQIDDMEATVFKAMLHFIYNDTLPEIDRDDTTAMAQHLLVAADRYRLERPKLICEDKLWYNINTSTLATTLALAEQHGCRALKEACFEFLKTTANLKAVMDSDGFQHLKSSFPSFPMELFTELFPSLFVKP